jgi:hypothetical protein
VRGFVETGRGAGGNTVCGVEQERRRHAGELERIELPPDVVEDLAHDGCLRDETDDEYTLETLKEWSMRWMGALL